MKFSGAGVVAAFTVAGATGFVCVGVLINVPGTFRFPATSNIQMKSAVTKNKCFELTNATGHAYIKVVVRGAVIRRAP
jgi:hypothetical protein